MLGSHRGGGVVAIANIESSRVSFSVIKAQSAHSYSMLTTRVAELPLEERESGQHLFALKQRLADIAKAAMTDYAKHHRGGIKKIYCILHAPWTTASVVRHLSSFIGETYITAAIIADSAAKAVADGKTQKDYLDAEQLPIKLNGYVTGIPEGKYAHSLEVAALVSSCGESVRRDIEATLREVAPTAQIHIHSGTRAVVGALQIARHKSANAVCLHVSGEGTEIIVVRDGVVESYTFIPEGVRSMLARAFPDIRPEDARKNIHAGQDGQTPDQLLKAESDMVHAYGEGFAAISSHLRLPNTLHLIADADMVPWLQKFFERIDFSQFTITAQPFVVDSISTGELGIETNEKEKGGELDTTIAIAHILREEYR